MGSSHNFFNLPNPSSHTMVLGFTQPLTEMSTRTRVEHGLCIRLMLLPSVSSLDNVGSTSDSCIGLCSLLWGWLYFTLFYVCICVYSFKFL
jgi:hypothetical protein